MKFLCVPCDRPMVMASAEPPDRGSIRAVYRCPSCSNRIAMLTNPLETQLVRSLGVEIGPRGQEGSGEVRSDAGGCPFSGMLAGMEDGSGLTAEELSWTADALARLEKMPDFVRPMARTGIERFARDRGYPRVDAAVLDEAKAFFGM